MHFVACPIDRAATDGPRKDPKAIQGILDSEQARFVLLHSKKVLAGKEGLRCWTKKELEALAPAAVEAAIYLGPWKGGRLAGSEIFAVDVTSHVTDAEGVRPADTMWCTGRDLLGAEAAYEDVTVAGMVLAVTNWHETAKFDGRTGKPTVPVEGGAKRQVEGGSGKLYPRTDPVAIGLIVSSDGRRCLLARGNKHAAGMYTCIAGFVDQCESIEDALRREAMEEVGIRLGPVELCKTQPWPIGRAGSCELMIGCKGVALTEKLKLDSSEIADARWFTRAEVVQMINGHHPQGFKVPGKMAIAHHLIQDFARAPPRLAAGSLLPGLALGCLVGFGAGFFLRKVRSRL